MGKLIFYITFLVLVDLLFIATGQICLDGSGCELSSIIFETIIDLENINSSTFFLSLIGNFFSLFTSLAGIGALIVAGGVTVGTYIATKDIKILLIPMTFTLALIAGDFVKIIVYLISLNVLLGTIFGALIIVTYILMIVDWWRGKD